MDLSKITSYAFHKEFSRIGEQFRDQEKTNTLLDEARLKLPLVDGFLGLLSELRDMPDQEERSEMFNRIMHDIHLIITLWKLGMEDDKAGQPSEAKDPSSGPGSLRLRRFGTN